MVEYLSPLQIPEVFPVCSMHYYILGLTTRRTVVRLLVSRVWSSMPRVSKRDLRLLAAALWTLVRSSKSYDLQI